MKTFFTLGLIAVALAVTTLGAAQGGGPPRGFGGPGMMGGPGQMGSDIGILARKDVQADLQLTGEQKSKVAELQKKYPSGPGQRGPGGGGPPNRGGGDFDPEQMRAEMEKRQAEQQKAVAAILTSEQSKRLAEIKFQIQGNMAVMDPKVQKAIGFTEDQNDRLQAALEDMRENMRPPDGGGGPPDRQEMEAMMKRTQDDMKNAIGKILTSDQKAKLKEMGGKPFKQSGSNQ